MKVIQIVFLAALSIVISSCGNGAEETPETTIEKNWQTAEVNRVTHIDQIRSTGRIVYEKELQLSFKTSGIIDRVYVKQGEQVKKGDLLAELKMDEIEARQQQADKAYQKAKRDYQRTEALYSEKVATLEQLQNMETQLELAKLDLETAEFNLKYASANAPSDGIIQSVLMEENEIIQAGAPVVFFGAYESGKVLITNMSDVDVVKIAMGDSVEIKSDAYPGEIFAGSVMEIAGMAIPQTGTFEVRILVDDRKNQLRSGFICSAVTFSSQERELLSIPVEGLSSADGKEGLVYLLKEDGPEKRKVMIERILGDHILVSEGVSAGDQVITRGL